MHDAIPPVNTKDMRTISSLDVVISHINPVTLSLTITQDVASSGSSSPFSSSLVLGWWVYIVVAILTIKRFAGFRAV